MFGKRARYGKRMITRINRSAVFVFFIRICVAVKIKKVFLEKQFFDSLFIQFLLLKLIQQHIVFPCNR